MEANRNEVLTARADVSLVGRIGSRIDVRTLPSGDEIVVFTIVVDRPQTGRRGGQRTTASRITVDAIACRATRADVRRRLGGLAPGDWVQAEGRLHRRFWRAAGAPASVMEVEVSRIRRGAS